MGLMSDGRVTEEEEGGDGEPGYQLSSSLHSIAIETVSFLPTLWKHTVPMQHLTETQFPSNTMETYSISS
jgi:hypothetical protein